MVASHGAASGRRLREPAMAYSLIALSGSLRAGSSNSALMEAAVRLAPAGLRVRVFAGIGELPHFNPDLDALPLPAPVAAWRAAVDAADGFLISCPEYARGIPGSFKNALDWLVSAPGVSDKPAALWNASPRAVVSQAALTTVLETMAAGVVAEAGVNVSLLGKSWTVDELLADGEIRPVLEAALAAFRDDLAGRSS